MGGGLLKMGTDGGDEGEIDGGVQGNFFGSLPEGFVANALSLTSPRDVCRLSLVCSVFRSAAEWDAVWEKFLPPNYQNILAEAGEGGDGGLVRSGSKKALYLRLCDHPVIIDGGNKTSRSFGATPLVIGDGFPFREVAELISVCWLEVHGRISTAMLSANTCYVAYLVYKSALGAYGFEYQPAEVSVGISGAENETKTVFLDQEAWQRQSYERGLPGRRMGMFNRVRRLGSLPAAATMVNGPKRRQDGWLEIELGEYWNQKGEEGEVEMSMTEVKGGNWKGGLIIQGIEIRIRHDR
ncbi:F-box domain, cyclin-like protein [Cynara cardunculus var. scolymus]|uniref:F-box domain, cyclin-like protein n=1 Tax=Cynara cardunculus var. scolymus TaxID=59895 RepID=A0A124SGY6_CYNCS|nr:F-box domain, cyclin-like protein [Cynara cardunculus var. scolymus]